MKRQPKGSRNGGQFAPDTHGKNGPRVVMERPELLDEIIEAEKPAKSDPLDRMFGAESAKAERMSWVFPENSGRTNFESSFLAQAGAIRPSGAGRPLEHTDPNSFNEAANPETLDSWVHSPRAADRARAAIYGQGHLTPEQHIALAGDGNYMVRYAYATSMPNNGSQRAKLMLDSDITVAYVALKRTEGFGPEWKPTGEIERTTVERFSSSEWRLPRMLAARCSEDPKIVLKLASDSDPLVRDVAQHNPALTQVKGLDRVRLGATRFWQKQREGLPF